MSPERRLARTFDELAAQVAAEQPAAYALARQIMAARDWLPWWERPYSHHHYDPPKPRLPLGRGVGGASVAD